MSRPVRGWTVHGIALTLLLLAGWSPAAEAASLHFRNETSMPVIVRGANIVNRTVRLGQPHLVQPGETCSDPILFPGNKLITIYDAKQPSRLLYQGTIPCAGTDQFFAIQVAEPRPDAPKSQKPAPPEVKLEPVPPPPPKR
jgi:hypothetical protein